MLDLREELFVVLGRVVGLWGAVAQNEMEFELLEETIGVVVLWL